MLIWGLVLVVSNYVSYFDFLFLFCVMVWLVVFMVKEELFNVFLLGLVICFYGVYLVKWGSGDWGVLWVVLMVLGDGWLVGVFLEGIRIKDGCIY